MNYKQIIKTFFIFVIAIIFTVPAISGAEQKKAASKEPIQIEADHMMSDKKQNSVYFSGKVAATQGDVIIHADEMTVYYNQTNGADSDETMTEKGIDRLLAVGNVEITKGEWVARGDNAEYFEAERKVVLMGNTKVWQNNSMVTGDKFTMYLDEGKSIVESNPKNQERVKAFFYPESDN